MTKKNIEAIYPLSPLQEGMLFHSLYAPASGVYVQQLDGVLHGELDLDAFRRAWQRVVDRHASLRTAYLTEGLDRPLQVVGRQVGVPLEVEDWRGLGADERTRRLGRLLLDEREKGFKMSKAPLMRLALFRLGDTTWHFAWTHHHIVVDGWSVAILLKEVFDLYEAYRRGHEPELRAARPYGDYIAWLERQDRGRAEAYWRGALRGFSSPTPLPGQASRGRAAPDGEYGRAVVRVDEASTSDLQRLAREARVTLGTLVQGAWAVVLGRYTREADVVFGVTSAGRPAEIPGVESMVGLFVNTLPMRVRIRPGEGLVPWLRELQDLQSEQREYEYSSLSDVQRWSELPAGAPLFESILAFENYPVDASRRDGAGHSLEIRDVTTSERTHYPLTLQVSGTDHLLLRALHDRSRIDDGSMQQVLEHIRHVLGEMVARPASTLSGIALLTPDERRLVVEEWSAPRPSDPVDGTLHGWLDARLAESPDRIAVELGERALTRAELLREANRVANFLKKRGVGPEVRVGVCMERSLEMVVVLLGVLKAGGAYVPLDPVYPRERLRYLRTDSGAGIILTQKHLLPRIREDDGADWIAVDDDEAGIARESDRAPEGVLSADHLAYVIYTSGSTGRPKGTGVTHRNVLRLFRATEHWFGFGEDDVWTLFHSFAFDFSVWEIFGALLYGGRLVVVPFEVSRAPEAFYRLLVDRGVTVLNQTPSAFRLLADAEEAVGADPALALRWVVFGGEALELESLRPWLARHGEDRPRLVNMYGITETTVHVTYRPLGVADLEPGRGSVIGRPIPDLGVYLLDDDLQPVPPGTAGEIFVGGGGVARGYLGRPGLAAERFVPDPWSGEPGARLYRSGDLARHLEDGELEYLGRADSQVKVRGFRVETGEIEHQLERHPRVRHAVVTLREDRPGDRQLVAYVVPGPAGDGGTTGPEEPLVSGLRAFLEERVPQWMVPAHFVALGELPLTPNGKVDRRALPAPEAGAREPGQPYVAPRTEREVLLAEAWAEVLGVERVGVHDNFFALGGDSILSIQVQSRARKRGVPFSLPDLFRAPTIAELALLEEQEEPAQDPTVPPFSLVSAADREALDGSVEDAIPLSRLQAGMLFHSELNPETNVFHDVFTSRLRAPLEVEALRSAVRELVGRHPVLRTSFDLIRFSEPLQRVHRDADVGLGYDDWSRMEEQECGERILHWVEEEKRRHFDWKQPGLVRFHVHRRSTGTFQFTMSCHHSILDGWSVATMLTELFQLYHNRLHPDRPLPIPPAPTTGTREFVALERHALASEETRRFWEGSLREPVETRIPRTPGHSGPREIRFRSVPLAGDLSERLGALARSLDVQLKSVLLAAHLRVLAAVTGSSSVRTGLVSSSRPETSDGDRALGLFLNTVPFTLGLEPVSWEELVRRTFRQEQEILSHRRFPIAEMQRMKGGAPLFEVNFNFLHFHVYRGVQSVGGIEYLEGEFAAESNFTLTTKFHLDIDSSELRMQLDYDAGQISEAQVERMVDCYLVTLEQMVASPTLGHHQQPLLTGNDMELRARWNATARDYPADRGLHGLVEEQAEQRPGATAVEFEGQRLTYDGLNRRANRLAHMLRRRGVGPDVMVGILMEPSLEMVVGVLAVLKAGGAYVPLEPTYPAERIRFMLEDTGLRTILTASGVPTIRDLLGAELIDLDVTELAGESEANPPSLTSPDSLAYVIYTSGSTGRPKGVALPHRGPCNMAVTNSRVYGIGPGARVLLFAPLHFDASAGDMFTALCTGATLCVGSRESLLPGPELLGLLRRMEVTHAKFTPSALAALPRADLPHFSTVITGGEVCTGELVARWAPGRRFINGYGPTEASVRLTAVDCTDGSRAPSIGYPISNVQLHVMNPFLQPLPVGAAGELFIGGVGLARCYWNRPELTAEKFIPDPFSGQPGSRLYRTGDAARYLDDGALEFLGRLDGQVKVRGFRIELGEIEAVLYGHPSVDQAVVAVRQSGSAESTLVCGLVPTAGADLDPLEVRVFLSRKLPDHMVPSHFHLLDSLPLRTSGKVDRDAALALLGDAQPVARAVHVPPTSAGERLVAHLWSQVLEVQEIGIHDDFFELGGHSLSATRLVVRLREAFQTDLPLARLFESPTVAGVVECLAESWGSRETVEEIAEAVLQVRDLSEEQIQQLLAGGAEAGTASPL